MTECWQRFGVRACGTFCTPWVSITRHIPRTNKKCSTVISCSVCNTFFHVSTAVKTCTKTIKRFRCTCVTWKIATRFHDTCIACTKSWTSCSENRVTSRIAMFENGTNTFVRGALWTMIRTKYSTLKCLNTIKPKKLKNIKKPDVQNLFTVKSQSVFWKLFPKMKKSQRLR